MGWADGIARGFEQRGNTLENPSSWLSEAFGAEDTYAGYSVNPTTAMRLIPVWSAVSLLAGSVGSLPLVTYKRTPEGKRERATSYRAYKLLHDKPNDAQAADEFWEYVQAQLCMWGNFYAAKERSRAGTVHALWPLPAPLVTVTWNSKLNRREYKVGESEKVHTALDIFHVRGLGPDPVAGWSPIKQARQGLGNAMAQEEYQGRMWRNSARPGGILVHPGELGDKARKRLVRAWRAAHEGPVNAGKVALLEEGIDWKQIGMSMADAQFVDQAKLTRTDIALLFRLPPHMLAAEAGGTSLTYSTTETASLDFVKWSLRRWLVRIERACHTDAGLFPQSDAYYPKFVLDALLRADTINRYRAHALGIKSGFLTRNEVREMEDRDPLDGLDEPLDPSGLGDDDLKDDNPGGQGGNGE